MKRPVGMSDDDWDDMMAKRKTLAVDRMTIADLRRGFVTIAQYMDAAKCWGVSHHEAELRLMRGETPDQWGVIE